ncbi:MAG: hypothetical protein C3F07_13070 [Anaerolineales bacterium]|nr:hypothetical protein [Anaerolineae bacterium]PWB71796.1 MAG: hypothetical protein C3F07_13070 [Anaerolineales bacterium]
MKPEITDISYSTALTFELVTRYDFFTLGAPTLPSLGKEVIYKPNANAKGTVVFLQYRLGDHIVGAGSSLKDQWGIPYYRFPIQPKKKIHRHELLMNLENMNNPVFYVAPEFHTIGGLYESLMNRTVLANSTFWSPLGIGVLTAKEKNIISYKHNTQYGILEPGNIKIEHLLKGEMLLNVLKQRFETNQTRVYDDNNLALLGDQMLENYLKLFHSTRERKLIDDIAVSRDRIEARDYLSLISTLLYDCYVYIVTT